MLVLCRLTPDVIHLCFDAFRRVAVGEIPVGNARGHVPRGTRTTTLENFRQRRQRLGLEGIITKAIEIAGKGKAVFAPDALQATDKLF